MLQIVVYGIIGISGLLSFIFGLVGVGVMTMFWRIMHILLGAVLILGALPHVLDFLKLRK